MPELPVDLAGRALQQWQAARPELDLAPAQVLARLRRLLLLIDPMLEPVLARHGLNQAAFDTLSTLRRVGPPYRMTASDLADSCLRTHATLTSRIARLERDELVSRSADPNDKRVVMITLTERGLRLVDGAAADYLEAERLVMSSLDGTELEQFAGLLQRMLLTFEGFDTDLSGGTRAGSVPALGLWLESLYTSLQMRRAVGVADRTGMIVAGVEPSGPAARAGIARGNMIVAVDGAAVTSIAILNDRLAHVEGDRVDVAIAREGGDDSRFAVELDRRPGATAPRETRR